MRGTTSSAPGVRVRVRGRVRDRVRGRVRVRVRVGELEHVGLLLEQALVLLRHLDRLLELVGLRVPLERGEPPLRLLLLELLLEVAQPLERLARSQG